MSKPVQAITPAALAQLEECIDPWPAPEVIDDGLSAVEAFNLRFLPESFRSWVADIAERMQVPLDFPAVIAVLCLAGAVNRRARIIPRSGMFRCASLMISAERLFEISFAPGSTNARHKTRSVFAYDLSAPPPSPSRSDRPPQTHRYRLISFGLPLLYFCSRTYNRILRGGIGNSPPSPIALYLTLSVAVLRMLKLKSKTGFIEKP